MNNFYIFNVEKVLIIMQIFAKKVTLPVIFLSVCAGCSSNFDSTDTSYDSGFLPGEESYVGAKPDCKNLRTDIERDECETLLREWIPYKEYKKEKDALVN